MTETRTAPAGDTQTPRDKLVEKGKRQLLIAPRRGPNAVRAGVLPMSASGMKGLLGTLVGVDVVRVLKPKKQVHAMSTTPDEATDVYVVRVDKDRAELLKQAAPRSMIVEEDAYLDYGGLVTPMRLLSQTAQPAALRGVAPQPIRIRVVNEAGKPVPGVKVTLTGDAFPAEGETDKKGELQLDLVTLAGGRARTLYAKANQDYWDRFVTAPELSTADVNVIRLLSLKSSVAGFPEQFGYGWGQRMMGLDAMPSHVTGKGVKIAIIDSGADNAHPLLRHLKLGLDFTNNADSVSWATDTVGHGSHCAGVITARSVPGLAMNGFAPDAEIHIFKIFPGGQFSSLLEALDECMARDIDIVNMSLGSDQVSEAVEQKLEECVLDGVACIVAAGNSGAAVQYPASSPNVLAVAAVGKLHEFPSEAWDSQTVTPGLVTPDGLFSPSFTCFGPQVGVCAPGVAIISTVPNTAFEPQSGTSMAAPHVTGLAALLLSHHPLFQTTLRPRGAQRVGALFNAIKSLCMPCPLGRERTGFGLPSLKPLAATLQPAPEAAAAAVAQPPAPAAEAPRMPPQPAPGFGFSGSPLPGLGSLESLIAAGQNQQQAQALVAQQLGALLQQLFGQAAAAYQGMGGNVAPFQAAGGQAGGVPFPEPPGRMRELPMSHPLFWAR